MGAVMSRRRAMRDLRARNSISSRNGKSFSGSYGLTLSADNGHGSGTLSSSLTSSLDNRALASFSISASRRFGCLISCAWANRVSRSPDGVDQLAGGLDSDSRPSRHVVDAIAAERLDLHYLVGADAEALAHLGLAD